MGYFNKDFTYGEIVYFIENQRTTHKPIIKFGTIEEVYPSEVYVQLYDFADNTLINGIPKKDLDLPTRWMKLPKDWRYDTALFDLSYSYISGIMFNFTNKQDIQKAIELGVYVKVQDNDYSVVEAEIDKSKGYRLVRKYPSYTPHRQYDMIPQNKVYKTYEEATKAVSDIIKEIERQKNLTDEEWSIEQIEAVINRWAKVYNHTEEEKTRIMQKFLEMADIENIEARVYTGQIQYKYWKNKKWLPLT